MPLAHIPGARRAARLALAAGLVTALAVASPALATAAPASPGSPTGPGTTAEPTPPGSDAPGKAADGPDDKLGSADAALLAKAKADGDKTVTFMVAGKPGSTAEISSRLHAQGASVGRTYDSLGYVRATVPTAKADAALGAAQKLPAVLAIDLKQEIVLDDPTPAADTTPAASRHHGTPARSYPGPDRHTPAKNPYEPAFETGAVDFVQDHPGADGRGVTVGILDSGVDIGHPALQKTTTGERKIVDWVTATDPILDGDGTWRPMVTAVSGPSFTASSRTWSAPAGSYYFSTFAESATKGGDMQGDLNRDGDTTDVWGVLYDPAAGTVRLDLDNDGDFGDETPMKPYKDGYQVGHFGTDDPATAISEAIPFTIEIRKDVPMDPYGGTWVGKKADFVNIGLVQSEHGTHVAGITAANGLFGGKMTGAAPGAKIVSSRACTWTGSCTSIALTEGMADLVINHHVDVVNMSVGGLGSLNDGASARDLLYTQLIDTYGVQLVISAGNDGPGVNTISDPGLADHVLSVGASISRETWAADYGSQTTVPYSLMPFSARGPREDGGLAPVITAPGAAINAVPTWEAGAPVKEAGYDLPPGYAMLQGTSMASPQAAGATALLLSAAKGRHLQVTPAQLRTALTSTARNIPGFQTADQGAGLIAVGAAWDLLRRGGTADTYTVSAPVDTTLSSYLQTPGYGTGIYDREGGLTVGGQRTYTVTVTRTSGAASAQPHTLRWAYDDGTFSVASPVVRLPLGKRVTVEVTARPRTTGVHSALLDVDDPRTPGTDTQIAAAVIVSTPVAGPSYTLTRTGTIQRDSTRSYFVTVPAGATALEVSMGGLKAGSQTRFISMHPYGVPLDSTQTPDCYPNYDNPANTCRPDLRYYADPLPGVWEIEVEARRTSPQLDNPYRLNVSVLGASFDPAVQTLPSVTVGTPTPVNWDVTNGFAAIDGGTLEGGPLGSALTDTPSIAEGDSRTTSLTVGAGVSRLDVAIGSPSDQQADLDLYVYRDGVLIAQSADGDAEESVSLTDPAPGAYTFEVDGYAVPAGTTTYSYEDVYYSSALGSVTVPSAPLDLAHGGSAEVTANVLAAVEPPAGRQLFGQVSVLTAGGTPAGTGSVLIRSATH